MVEHIVEPFCRGDTSPVALVDRIEGAAKHRFQHISHAQRLARCSGQSDSWALARSVVEVDRL